MKTFKEFILNEEEGPWSVGTKVKWHYRTAIGTGRIAGYKTKGATHAATEYKLQEFDHHPGEPEFVYHWGTNVFRA